MTNVDVLEVDAPGSMARAGVQFADVGRLLVTGLGWILYAVGWTLARLLRVVAVAAGAVPYAVGWSAGRAALAGRWVWAAVCVGYDDGRRQAGARR